MAREFTESNPGAVGKPKRVNTWGNMKTNPNTAKRIAKLENAVKATNEPDHEFRIALGWDDDTKFFVDGIEVSEAVFLSYKPDYSKMKINWRLVNDPGESSTDRSEPQE